MTPTAIVAEVVRAGVEVLEVGEETGVKDVPELVDDTLETTFGVGVVVAVTFAFGVGAAVATSFGKFSMVGIQPSSPNYYNNADKAAA